MSRVNEYSTTCNLNKISYSKLKKKKMIKITTIVIFTLMQELTSLILIKYLIQL
jgi:hypothetical protein